ncbi:MAG: homoserine dehydrogenase [Synergistales bacterium]|nr:homoserine dehydrogenase [Synergistales bacterium]
MDLRIFLVGFGNVGRAFSALLKDRVASILCSSGVNLKLAAVATRSKGTACHDEGLEISHLLESERITGRVDSSGQKGVLVGKPVVDMIEGLDFDVLVECSSPDLERGEPATSYIMMALDKGKDVVTSNKGPLFHNYHILSEIASQRKASFLFEGTVMTGTPVFSLFRRCLIGSRVLRIEGVLNGTSNFILDMMKRGSSFERALMEVQRRAYSEPDPFLDIDGWDSASKASIIAQVLMDAPFTPFSEISIEGIRTLDPDLFIRADRMAGSVRLICRVEKQADSYAISVKPEILPSNHPLCSVSGITNGALFMTDTIGEICITGAGAGPLQTAHALLMDILSLQGNFSRR